MSDRPIIFSAPMVRAILDGRKSQTRRVVKPRPAGGVDGCYHRPDGRWIWLACGGNLRTSNEAGGPGVGVSEPFRLPFAVGDRLWIRENTIATPAGVAFAADGRNHFGAGGRLPIRPSIHMPRHASRITLTVTAVRVERLQDITDDDAIAEGMKGVTKDGKLVKYGIPDRDGWPGNDDFGWPWHAWKVSPRDAFADLWNSINGEGAWAENPFVVAVTFTTEFRNIDR